MPALNRHEAIGHVDAIASRLKAAGVESSTLARLSRELKTEGPVTADRITLLQSLAMQFETVLLNAQALSLGDYNLPALRLLLSQAIPQSQDAEASRSAAEVHAAIAAALAPSPSRGYHPGHL
ncbi:hypothetical protein [Protaetiibacter larvae]|uniref:Uncharacterized protein n=1 Tax=Protaetiibacter larvae TaxID=2592654 RepID=A0A5C1YAD4_9MICO|nr:hypothetical protein [Protaetiibacter larvae]QEO10560.1 hypothetical protein FLP23_11445 [Protaetiibacter larvae]